LIGRLFKGQGAKTQISLGLVSILVCVNIGASFLGLFPDRYSAILAGRSALAEIVAVNSSVFITRSDLLRMEANLQILVTRNDEILSAAVKPKEGKAVAIVGDHESQWQTMAEGVSTEAQLVVPIWEGDTQWGHIELRFKPLKREGFLAFFFEPLAQFIMFVSFFCFIFFKFYLSKMLKQLDPSQAIPDRVRSALDTMAEGLLVLDAKQNIVLANEAFSTLVSETSEQLMGRSMAKFTWRHAVSANDTGNPSLVVDQKYPWEIALESSVVQINHMLYLQLDDKSRHTFMVNCSPVLGPNGKAAGVMVSFDDITELEEKEIELRRSKEEAETANRTKSDFLSNMSHEIRTPMNAILGFTEVLIRGYSHDPADSKRYLNTIASSGKHLLGLINDILDLSKVEAGRIEIETLPSTAHKIVQEVVKVMTVKAKEKHISLEFIALNSMPEYVLTDAGKIRQILTNLVGNSIKFTESGSVKLTTDYQPKGAKAVLTISVADTGIGMTQDQASAVFNPFVQADSSITRRFGGTGLGLTISKRFAEALGGDIVVKSEQGKGSTFIIAIDVEPVPGARMLLPAEIMKEAVSVPKSEQTKWIFPPAKVLVVDDGDENRDLLDVVLADAGLNIETAVNGKQGLDLALVNAFDLILMDVQMPEMDGYTSVRLMRENGLKIPVIALTAHAMKGAERECLAAGYSGYMTKPIDIDTLLTQLAEELGGKASHTTEVEHPPKEAIQQDTQIGKNQALLTSEPAIRSSLPGGAAKYRSLIERFVVRLKAQFITIEKAASSAQYNELADLAHWLKGSAGSVGFHNFTEPAEDLEHYANQQDTAGITEKIRDIKALISRIEIDDNVEAPIVNTGQRGNMDEIAVLEPVAISTIVPATKIAPIRSSLIKSTPKLKPMAEKFIVRLDEKIALMVESLENRSFQALADLAHWLKGSAGTLGFHEFTDPATELECAANDENAVDAHAWLERIKLMAKHIDLSDETDKHDASKIS
jgi:signal transduction histidine kinase/DNA-binding NarL/FixJ family response regulator